MLYGVKSSVTLGYELVDLTVLPSPSPRTASVPQKNVLKGKPVFFGVIQLKRPQNVFFSIYSLKSDFDKLKIIS